MGRYKPEELKPNTLKYQVGNVNYLISHQHWKECYGEINIYHPKTDTHWFCNSNPTHLICGKPLNICNFSHNLYTNPDISRIGMNRSA